MSRTRVWALATASAAGALGCAHCDTCDDFPAPVGAPYATSHIGTVPYGPTVYQQGPSGQLPPPGTYAPTGPIGGGPTAPPNDGVGGPPADGAAGATDADPGTDPGTGTDAEPKEGGVKPEVVPDPDAKATANPGTTPPVPGAANKPKVNNDEPPIVPLPLP